MTDDDKGTDIACNFKAPKHSLAGSLRPVPRVEYEYVGHQIEGCQNKDCPDRQPGGFNENKIAAENAKAQAEVDKKEAERKEADEKVRETEAETKRKDNEDEKQRAEMKEREAKQELEMKETDKKEAEQKKRDINSPILMA